jgi:ParB family chromosome partitioning protein
LTDDFSPSLPGKDESLAPVLGTAPTRGQGKRPWWLNLKGPIAVLLADLTAQSPRVRRRAAEALARRGDRRAVAALAQGLRDADWEVRLACIQALARLGGDGVAEPLARATREGNARVRIAAAEALAQHGDTRGLAALEALAGYLEAAGLEADRAKVLVALATLKQRLTS